MHQGHTLDKMKTKFSSNTVVFAYRVKKRKKKEYAGNQTFKQTNDGVSDGNGLSRITLLVSGFWSCEILAGEEGLGEIDQISGDDTNTL